jgi:hypothetical protein
MPNGVELFRCVLFGSCYNVAANVGILVASNVAMSVLLYFMTKKQFHKVHSEALHKLGHLVNPTNIQTQQGASAAGVGMAIGAH